MCVNSNPAVYKQNVKTSWLKILINYRLLTPTGDQPLLRNFSANVPWGN